MRFLTRALVVLALGIGSAKADSDGYFCSSSAFLAYEFSYSKEPSDQHKLYLVRFGAEPKGKPQWLKIPGFQVHGMRCSADRVEMVGWDKRYVYAVTGESVTATLEENLPAPGKFPEGFSEADNLGGFSPVTRGEMPASYTYPLTTNRPDGNYEIHIVRKKTKDPCTVLIESSLFKLGPGGKGTKVKSLYKATVPIECGE